MRTEKIKVGDVVKLADGLAAGRPQYGLVTSLAKGCLPMVTFTQGKREVWVDEDWLTVVGRDKEFTRRQKEQQIA